MKDARSKRCPPTRDAQAPVVAIAAASEAAFEAMRAVLAGLPPEIGARLLFLPPPGVRGAAALSRLAGASATPLRVAEDGLAPAPDALTVMDHGDVLGLREGGLFCERRDAPAPAQPVDAFFGAVAAGAGAQTIAVALSGDARDGAEGLRRVRAAGGFALAAAAGPGAGGETPAGAVSADAADLALAPAALAAGVAARLAEIRGAAFAGAPQAGGGESGAVAAAERAVLDRLGPGFAVVGPDGAPVHVGGPIGRFLRSPGAASSGEIAGMVRASLADPVRALLRRARADGVETRREGLCVEAPDPRRIDIRCAPVRAGDGGETHHLLSFHDLGPMTAPVAGEGDPARVRSPETEPRAARTGLRTPTEERETANGKLRAANEDRGAMNRALGDANARLAASQRELEAVNTERAGALQAPDRADDDDPLSLLDDSRIAALFLDGELRLRRFTRMARTMFGLGDEDCGHVIDEIAARVPALDIAEEARRVFRTLAPVERALRLEDRDLTCRLRPPPQRTPQDRVEGVVATFVDVTAPRRAERAAEEANARLAAKVAELEALMELAPVGVAIAEEPSCSEIRLNARGAALLGSGRVERPVAHPMAHYRVLRDGVALEPRALPLQTVWRTGRPVQDFRATFVHDDGACFEMIMSAAPVMDGRGRIRRVIGVIDDVSDLVAARRAAEMRAAQQNLIARLGGRSLRGVDGPEMTRALPGELARLLGVEFAKVLRLDREAGDLVLEAAHGFPEPVGTRVPGDVDSQAGYTLRSHEPVVVGDMAAEPRFSGPALLTANGVMSGVSVIIGDPDAPWGVLGVHARARRDFTADDVTFVQSAANILAATLQRDDWLARQRLLLDELRHRVKNNLAVVQATARISFRDGPPDPRADAFLGRLHALAAAQEALFSAGDETVELADLLGRQLAGVRDDARVALDGPRAGARLPMAFATDMSIAIHELATNAARHGALAQAGGSLSIAWRVEGGRIRLDWTETGLPDPAPPPGRGGGSRLLDSLFRRAGVTARRAFGDGAHRLTLEIDPDPFDA